MVDSIKGSSASKIEVNKNQAEPQGSSKKGMIAGPKTDDNSCQRVDQRRQRTHSNKKHIALQLGPDQSEVIGKGIEAHDVDSLLDQFLEYEQEQKKDMVQTSQHDHTYATSSEQCRNQTGNMTLSGSTISPSNIILTGSCNSMNNNFDNVENCKSHPFDVELCRSESLDPQCSKKLDNKTAGCKKENNNNEKDNSSGNDSDAENRFGVLRINKSKNKTRFYQKGETSDDLDEFGRNTSLAKFDRDIKKYKGTRGYQSSSEDESESIDDRTNLSSHRNASLQNSEEQSSRRKRSLQIDVSNEHSSKRARKHYNIEQERKLNFKFDYQVKDSAQEERRVVYIGRISRGTTQRQVWKRFREFGPIEKVTVHFRDDGITFVGDTAPTSAQSRIIFTLHDNYAFVTFFESSAAVEAVESGKTDSDFDISFGGRRKYCGGSYVDFDSNTSFLEEQEFEGRMAPEPSADSLDFDSLLNMCLKSTRKR